MSVRVLGTVLPFALLLAAPLHAQPADAARLADQRFEEGQALMTQQRPVEACVRFEESRRLSPSGRALFYLGECHARTGRPTAARAHFLEAAARAQQAKRPELEELARDRARALDAEISTLTVRAESGAAMATVYLDDRALTPGELNVALPLDPGEHHLRAGDWSTTVVAPAQQQALDVQVPAMRRADAAGSSAGSPAVSVPGQARSPGGGQRTAGLVLGGVGAASVLTGVVFGVLAVSRHADVEATCPANVCASEAVREAASGPNDSGRAFGTVSTITLAAGGAVLAAGILLYLTAPSRPHGLPSTALRW